VEPNLLPCEPVTVFDPVTPAPVPARRSDGLCAVCRIEMTAHTATLVNGRALCLLCACEAEATVAPVTLAGHLPALVGGLIGALLGAAIFAGIGIATQIEIGYVAVLIGFLAGRGVRLGARQASSPSLQSLAMFLAIFGLLAAKYMVVAWVLADKLGLSPLSASVLGLFVDHIGDLLSPFDVLWVILAGGAALRASASTSPGRG
jgi:hypothetical protein